MNLLHSFNWDALLSDPMMLVGAILLVAGPLLFIIALWKWITYKKEDEPFQIPSEPGELENFYQQPHIEAEAAPPAQEESSQPTIEPAVQQSPVIPPEPEAPPVTLPRNEAPDEKTVVLAAGIGELQGQMEIAFSQIKNLNKKVNQLEEELESVARHTSANLDVNELKELPMNPSDFIQKLLKLAEHVIVLEKEMAKIKGTTTPAKPAAANPPAQSATPAGATQTKPPIMPL